jgi:hypothetical protein
MAAELHPAATEHLPSFITPPGETDILMVVTALILAASIMGFGLIFFRLHSLPERMAHGAHPLQLEIVAVLCLIALLTHIHAFWIAALLIALIEVPDFGGWAERIAGGVEKIAGRPQGEGVSPPTVPETVGDAKPPETASPSPPDSRSRAARKKMEAGHA